MRNIFLQKSCKKNGGGASLDLFHKMSKLSIYLDQQSGMLQSLFLLYAQVEVCQNTLKLSHWPLAFSLYEAFLKK